MYVPLTTLLLHLHLLPLLLPATQVLSLHDSVVCEEELGLLAPCTDRKSVV